MKRILIGIVVAFFCCGVALQAQAASVSTVAELIAAIEEANATDMADTIHITDGAVLLFSERYPNSVNALPVISTPITIRGNGSTLRCGADEDMRLFEIHDSVMSEQYKLSNKARLEIDGMRILGCDVGSHAGGAIQNLGGVLIVNRVSFESNLAKRGGAIANDGGIAVVNNSTFSSNRAVSAGGAIYNEGSFGGVDGELAVLSGHVDMSHVTMHGNIVDAGRGGGWYNAQTQGVTENRFRIKLSLIAGNHSASDTGHECFDYGAQFGQLSSISMGYNLIRRDPEHCGVVAAVGDRFGLQYDPKYDQYTDHGGAWVWSLLEGSAAMNMAPLDECSTAGTVTDQLGNPRIFKCDAGAYEGGQILDSSALRYAVQAVLDGNALTNEIVLPFGMGFVFSDSAAEYSALPIITEDIVIRGNGSVLLRASNAEPMRFFTVDAGASLSLHSVELEGGLLSDVAQDSGAGGAVLVKYGALRIEDSVLNDNHAAASGGAVATHIAELRVKRSSFENNSAQIHGGAIAAGVVDDSRTHARIDQSDFFLNTAVQGDGGGLDVRGETNALVARSTFIGNRAVAGGGVASRGEQLSVLQSTIVASQGSGLRVVNGMARVGNTVLSGNSGSNGVENCDGGFLSFGHNAIGMGNSSCPGVIVTDIVDLTHDQLLFGAASDNGDPGGRTVALQWGSPLINGGNTDLCIADFGPSAMQILDGSIHLDADQLGNAWYGACSIGATNFGGYCGDGLVQPSAGEGCDSGVNCNNLCQFVVVDQDNDGVPSSQDSDDNDQFHCLDSDADGCDDCTNGSFDPSNDGLDSDGDGICDVSDPVPPADADGDGVTADLDINDSNPNVCQDSDADGCDDCSSGTFNPANDGEDSDGDGICDVTDPADPVDADGDLVLNTVDSDDANPNVCMDSDADGCDDCSSGVLNPSNDGPDADGDGLCDVTDPVVPVDADGDGVLDDVDSDDGNAQVCYDADLDGCDDCSSGTVDAANDGPDADGDGLCDVNDPIDNSGEEEDDPVDGDGDGVMSDLDSDDNNPHACADVDGDGCDDCSSGGFDHLADGTDSDGDGICDLTDEHDGLGNGSLVGESGSGSATAVGGGEGSSVTSESEASAPASTPSQSGGESTAVDVPPAPGTSPTVQGQGSAPAPADGGGGCSLMAPSM